MKRVILAFLILIPLLLIAVNDRGLTTRLIESVNPTAIGQAPIYSGQKNDTSTSEQQTFNLREGWQLVDSLNFDCYLDNGENFGFEYNGMNNTISLLNENLIDSAKQALQYAPQWMYSRLASTLMRLEIEKQELWSDVILSAQHPYVDEIAFSIAYSSVEYLSSEFAYPRLFIENAWLIYEHDQDLSYVEVMDYGTPDSDDDYYSTTKYWKSNSNGGLYQVEVPREIYYMYLVHPKNTDEIPAYIDKDIIEHNSDHQNNIVSPDNGYFWRDFLYNHNDPGYPKLKYYLQDCDIVWNGSNLSIDTAVGALTRWLGQSMQFTSNTERPHQPVRIYEKHIGRCGEHADMRSAIARLALIPCTSILTISGDHTWNEFWDEGWIHWDGNDVNNPLLYENGWGKQYGTVFEIRSDGLITPVTDRYSEGTAWITVYVLDMDGNPVDGARIIQGVYYDNRIKSDFVGFTDNEGKYTFEVGEGRQYYAQMTSALGDVPGYLVTVEEAEDGMEYEFELLAPGYMPEIPVTEIDIPVDDVDDFKLVFDYTVPNQTLFGNIVFNDLDGGTFFEPITNGDVNFFMMDLINYYSIIQDAPFEAFNSQFNAQNGICEFDMVPPAQGSWYAVLNNDNHVGNPQQIKGSVALYAFDGSGGTGIISGTVWDESNNAALEGAIVRAGVYETVTANDGTYSLEVYPNTYDVFCEIDNYCLGFNDAIVVTDGSTETSDFNILERTWAVTDFNVIINDDQEAVLSWNAPEALDNGPTLDRELTEYKIYLGHNGTELDFSEWDLTASGITETHYTDLSWQYYQEGIYKYAVIAEYSGENVSQPVFSEVLFCNMTVDVTLNITSNSGDPVTGAIVEFHNQESSNSVYNYFKIVEESETVVPDVMKGVYQIQVSLPNFEIYSISDVEILDDTSLEVELVEQVNSPYDLCVLDYQLSWNLDYVDRSLQNFQIYYDGELMGVDIEQEYVLPNTPGFHTAAVKAIYSTDESSLVEIEYENGSSLNTDLELYIPFEDNLQDISDNNFQSSVIGALTYHDNGTLGRCVEFDEIGEYVTIDSVFPEVETQFSVAWWINPDSLFNWNQQIRSPQGWNGFVFHSTNEGTIYTGIDTGTRFSPNTLEDGIYTDEWNFFCYTYKNGRARFFRNGNLIGQRDGVAAPESWNGFQLGTENQNTLDGMIDELKIWKREVSTTEIGSLYLYGIEDWCQVNITATSEDGTPVTDMNVRLGMIEGITSHTDGTVSIDVPRNTTYLIKYQKSGYDLETIEKYHIGDNSEIDLNLIYHFTGNTEDVIPNTKVGIISVSPNPFNPETKISFVNNNSNATTEIHIYNVKGQIVKTLLNSKIDAGNHQLNWKGNDDDNSSVSSGIYFIRMKNGDLESVSKAMLIK